MSDSMPAVYLMKGLPRRIRAAGQGGESDVRSHDTRPGWSPAAAAALWVCAALSPCAAREELPLLDLARDCNVTNLVRRDVSVSLVSVAGRPALRLATGHVQDWPGIDLPAPGGRWDLSAFHFVKLDVTNAGTNAVEVNCRVDNPNVERGMVNCVTDRLTLEPGRSATLTVELRRKKPDWVKVELFGMRGYPWGIPLPWLKPNEAVIEGSNVVNLVVFVARPKVDHVFEIANIRASGPFTPPTERLQDPALFFPFIDEFGQYVHGDWPGKTRSATDFARRRAEEEAELKAQPGPDGWDRYGGWRDGPTLKATGFFYPAKHAGQWWLVDPEGHLFFSHGIDCVRPDEGRTPIDERTAWFKDLPPPDGEFKDCYSTADSVVHGYYQGRRPRCYDFGKANLMRKYGQDWPAACADVAHRRLRSWGLNTIANWSDPAIYLQKRTPYTAAIWFGGKKLEGSSGYWGPFRDVFDPSFQAEIRKWMALQAGKSAGDPWCIGYFVDNEIAWGDDDVSLAVAALRSPASQAAKQAFVADLQNRYTDIAALNAAWGSAHVSWDALLQSTVPPDVRKAHADLAAFHARTAETYFKTVRDAVKAVAPHNLYLGCRFSSVNAPAVAAAAKYCDVVSYNLYRRSVADFRLPVEADVPVIIGEFHFGALDRGLFHTGLVAVEDQAARADAYRDYVRGALQHPQIVGCHWFKYMDEPTTGRFYDEENYQIGFVDIADTPYPETLAASRAIGATLYRLRSGSQRVTGRP